MLKNMTIGRKLALGFGLVLVLLTLVGAIAFRGISQMGTGADEVIAKNELIQNLTLKEIDHLNWANKVVALLTDSSVTELNVQTDDHKCGFGQWLYGDGRTHAETEIPELVPIFKEIEGHHHKLHTSAIHIGESFQPADMMLSALLQQRKVDHLAWAHRVKDVFVDESLAHADVETDSHKCGFGQWLYSDAVNKLRQNDPEFARLCLAVEEPHRQLHESAVRINEFLAENRRAEGAKYYMENTKPTAYVVLGHIDEIIAWNDKQVAGMQKASEIFATETKPCLHKVQELIAEAVEHVGEVTAKTNEGMVASAKSTKLSVSTLSLAAVVIGIAAALLIARGIISALKRIIDSLNEGSEQVAAASGQVSSASQSLAEGATEQAAGLEETSSSLEEMSSMTKQNADNAQQANTLAAEARKAADTGAESMNRMNSAIHEIQNSSDETAKIIKVIDEIAFQTNLLALNAAVEAARAGEAGKGFAVVAEEVRNLAMRSAEAAKNTASMIAESVKNAKNGVDIAGEVGKVLDDIVQGVGKTTDLVSEIAAASQEQAQGIDQVNTAVAQMDKVTQQNAANAEESASASEELSAQAESMNEIVSDLVKLVGGSSTTVKTSSKRHSRGSAHRGSFNAGLGRSDETFHTIAHHSTSKGWNPSRVSSKTAADELIPLDGDNFDDFNG